MPVWDIMEGRGADLLAAWLAATHGLGIVERVDVQEFEAGRAILDASPEDRAAVVVAAFAAANDRARSATEWSRIQAFKTLVPRLLRAHLPFTDAQLVDLMRTVEAGGPALMWIPLGGVVAAVEHHAEGGLSGPLRSAVARFAHGLDTWAGGAERKLAARLERVLVGPQPVEVSVLPLDAGPWQAEVKRFLDGNPAAQAWCALLVHAATAADKARPSAKWSREAAALVEAIGAEAFVERLLPWLQDAGLGPHPSSSHWADFLFVVGIGHGSDRDALSEHNRDVLKGLVWMSAGLADPEVPPALGRFAARCFRKVPGWGAQSTKLGNAAVWALGALPDAAGVVHLSRVLGKVRYAVARRLIEAALADAAERAGVDRTEVEEMSIPDFGLGPDGTRRDPLGEFHAELAIVDGKEAALRWIRPDGKAQASVPQALKDSFADDLKSLKAEHKELRELLDGQAARIERTWLTRSEPWPFATWRERYLDHAVVGPLARKLLWTLGPRAVLWSDGALRDVEGNPVLADDATPVRLWHPIEAPPQEVLAWRVALEARGVVQPIKQAWREIYALTPAEETTDTYSNRFAAHVIRQHQFMAVAHQRGWRYTLQGAWDSANTPVREVEPIDWRIEWWVEPAPDRAAAENGFTGFTYLTTDQVRFTRLGEAVPAHLSAVPPRVFSELMRDVDLFVAVCSIGNDPNWADGGPGGAYAHYYDAFSFGDLSETAKTRAQALERLVPRLKIRDVARVDGRWLVVNGKRNVYKIHLGSGNIQMDGRGYLCIVPDRGLSARDRVLLPFDDDSMLSLILSKAFLLAADDGITDPSILRQIKR